MPKIHFFHRRPLALLLLALASLLLPACVITPLDSDEAQVKPVFPATDKLATYNIVVDADREISAGAAQVDIVAVNLGNLEEWAAQDISAYWQPDNPRRNAAVRAMLRFGLGQPGRQIVFANDPMWVTWLDQIGATHLVIIADLPGPFAAKTGAADPRRRILPLARSAWKPGTATIEVKIEPAGLTVLTPQVETGQ